MKFTLIMTICSQIYATCLPPLEQDYLYETHFDCATIGYLRSFDTLNKLGSERVNNERIVVNFYLVVLSPICVFRNSIIDS